MHRPSSVQWDPEGYIYIADWGQRAGAGSGSDGSSVKPPGPGYAVQVAADFLNVNPDEKRTRRCPT